MRCDYLTKNRPVLEKWIKLVNAEATGRTRYEGQEPFVEELAVAEIEYLRVRNIQLETGLVALRDLHDCQNDAPLEKYRVAWEAAMEKTVEILRTAELE